MSFFDTHAHLGDGQFLADRSLVLERAAAAGISRIVEIADAPADWDAALALSRARPGQVRCALGLHPYYADQFSDELVEKMRRHAHLPEVVAIGEIGLDYVKASISRDVQLTAFKRILALCRELDKPCVIHCRGAYADLREILADLFPKPPEHARFWGVVHCFSGTENDAIFCTRLGFALGVDGPVTYPKNSELRAALRAAGLGTLVLETDSPYLPPQSARGKRNEPSAIAEIAAKVAETFGLPPEDVAAATTANALSLYRFAVP